MENEYDKLIHPFLIRM